jgi:Xaa-Pro aminopeptidase
MDKRTLSNKKRARRYMEEYNLEAIVASTPVNVAYFTGFECWMYRGFRENMSVPGASNSLKQAYAMISVDSAPRLVIDTFTAPFLAEEGVEIRGYGSVERKRSTGKRGSRFQSAFSEAISKQRSTPAAALKSAFEEISIVKGRVGVELGNLSDSTRTLLKKSFPKIELLDCPELIRFIRMVKTEEELARLKGAARISEIALNKSLAAARPGARTAQLLLTYGREVAKKRASLEHYIFSPGGMGISSHGDYVFREGECTSVDCGCVYKMYYGDTGTTLIIGNGRKDVEKMHRRLWNIVEESTDMLHPGNTPSEVLAWFARVYEKEGIRGVSYQGHGIGLETREHPVINKGGFSRIKDRVVDESIEIPFEEGMTINIETPIYDPGRASYQVERTFLIGRRSVREMTPTRDGSAFVNA